jgi:hypothetical protein
MSHASMLHACYAGITEIFAAFLIFDGYYWISAGHCHLVFACFGSLMSHACSGAVKVNVFAMG